MATEVLFNTEARKKILQGIIKLSDTVKETLGPRGRNVMIEQSFGAPLIINDGVTIAKAISFKDKYENLGAQLIIEAASKTNDASGDGTTTAVILSSELIKEGIKYLDQGVSPVDIKEGFEYYLPIIEKMINKRSIVLKDNNDISLVASLSSGSKEIGNIIGKAYLEVGFDGEVTVEESKGLETSLEVVKGYFYDRGYASSYMASNDGKNNAEMVNCDILVTDKKINSVKEILPFLENAVKSGNPLLIICDDMEQEVLNSIVLNKLRGAFNVVVTKAPSFGDRKIEILKDIAVVTKANFISTTKGDELSNSDISILGKAEKVIVEQNKTIIMNGSMNDLDTYNHVLSLKQKLENETSSYEQDKLKERIAKLTGGIAVIKVGAATEVELKDKKLRIEDALCATKAAKISGTIEGAGKVLYEISNELKLDERFKESYEILIKVLKMPFYQIVTNAGCDPNLIEKEVNHNKWFDAKERKYCNLRRSGIIDPTSVEVNAIKNAISVASSVLTTSAAVININEAEGVNYDE